MIFNISLWIWIAIWCESISSGTARIEKSSFSPHFVLKALTYASKGVCLYPWKLVSNSVDIWSLKKWWVKPMNLMNSPTQRKCFAIWTPIKADRQVSKVLSRGLYTYVTMFRMQTSSVSPLTRLFKVLRTAVMVLSSEVSLLFSQFEPVPFSLPKTLPDNKSQGMQTTFSTSQSDCPSKTGSRRSSNGCSIQEAVFDLSHHFLFFNFHLLCVFPLNLPFNGLSCSICLPLVLSIFWEEIVGGVERGIKREVQDRIKGWRMGGSLIGITCYLISTLKSIDFTVFTM